MEFRYSRNLISLENLSIFSTEYLLTKIIMGFFNVLGSYGEETLPPVFLSTFEIVWKTAN